MLTPAPRFVSRNWSAGLDGGDAVRATTRATNLGEADQDGFAAAGRNLNRPRTFPPRAVTGAVPVHGTQPPNSIVGAPASDIEQASLSDLGAPLLPAERGHADESDDAAAIGAVRSRACAAEKPAFGLLRDSAIIRRKNLLSAEAVAQIITGLNFLYICDKVTILG